MSNGARIGLLVGTVVVLVLAFVLLSPEVDEDSGTATTPTVAPTVTTPGEPQQTATADTPPPPPVPDFETIRVRGGMPVGGVQTVTVSKGDRARIRVTSTDTTDEIHLHGYDRYADVAPGKPAQLSFTADAEGIFEIELHGTGTQIAKLAVEP